MQQYFNAGHMSVMDFFPVSNQFTVSWLVIHVFNVCLARKKRKITFFDFFGGLCAFKPFTTRSDQKVISPCNVITLSSTQVMRIKGKSTREYCLIQYQILRTNIINNIWQTVTRITIEIVEVKGLKRYGLLP